MSKWMCFRHHYVASHLKFKSLPDFFNNLQEQSLRHPEPRNGFLW